jgi:hypothetical protein
VFENSVLRTIFGPTRDDDDEEEEEELCDFYSLPNLIRMIMSRRMIWAWHVI